MANVRDFDSLGVFAENANPTIPATPVPGTAYINENLTPAENEAGYGYLDVFASANNNKVLNVVTNFTDTIAEHGLLGWSDNQSYTLPSIVYASDNNFYVALLPSDPIGTGAQDPITATTYWKQLSLSSDDEIANLSSKIHVGDDSGSANAHVVTLLTSNPPTEYGDGMEVAFAPTNSNTGVATVNVNGLGVITIQNLATPLVANDLRSGAFTRLYYDGGVFKRINAEKTTLDKLAETTGAAGIGTTSGDTVQEELDSIIRTVAMCRITSDAVGVVTFNEGVNIASINSPVNGVYDIVYSTPFADAEYVPQATCASGTSVNRHFPTVNLMTQNGCRIETIDVNGDVDKALFSFSVQKKS